MKTKRLLVLLAVAAFILSNAPFFHVCAEEKSGAAHAPAPLLEKGQPVDWWFVFKFNDKAFPGCGETSMKTCLFGGTVQDYGGKFSQQYVFASSKNPALQKGKGCLGGTMKDPVGSTFDTVYNGSFFYVLWNDQFYGKPLPTRSGPWGHSKGLLAWNDAGEGFVMQVSTPSWPASGSSAVPRDGDGNTLGCISSTNNVKVSQHFFALRLNKGDAAAVLSALQNASIVTDPDNPQIVKNGGPQDLQDLVNSLGKKSKSNKLTSVKLSSGVQLISKPSRLGVPPWQMVSAMLDRLPLRTATWWHAPWIPTTTASTRIGCWDRNLGASGPVEIATSGQWDETPFGLKGVTSNGNHAKIGVSKIAQKPFVVFGDLNQQGALSDVCNSSQNGRGGVFFVLENDALFHGVSELIKGTTAPAE